jgi:hypothetical protein
MTNRHSSLQLAAMRLLCRQTRLEDWLGNPEWVRRKPESRTIAEMARKRGKAGLNRFLDLTSSMICK